MNYVLLLLLLLLAPSVEATTCARVCSCDPSAEWLAWGRVDASGRFTASTVVTRDGGAASPAVPASVSTGLSGDIVVDSWGTVGGASGAATLCNNVTVPAQEWAAANFTESCDTLLAQKGFTEPPCGARRGCSATIGAPLVVAALAALGAMRRRRGAPSTETRALATRTH